MEATGNLSNTASMSSLPRREIILTIAGLMVAMFLASLDQTIVSTAMPRIITDLGGFTLYTWVTTIYIFTGAITVSIIGKLTDMYGRKWFFYRRHFYFCCRVSALRSEPNYDPDYHFPRLPGYRRRVHDGDSRDDYR
jgi:hypothetical protein